MNVLLVHNYYMQPGGEDQVFHAEAEILRAHGNAVRTYALHNTAIPSMHKLRVAKATIWNERVVRELGLLLQQDAPDLVHFHNTFPLVSPGAYAAPRRLGIPVVQTLHNYRLLCLNGLFLRDGAICEDCLGKAVPLPGIVHACYRDSRQASAVTAAMIAFHRLRGTWSAAVDTYVALSEFARGKFIAGGIPAERIVVKPNFILDDPGVGQHSGGYALFVGRLSPEKGVEFIARLWGQLSSRIPLRIIGSGPLERLASEGLPGVEWLGWQPRDKVLAAMREAAFLVFPSEWYEPFGMVLVEAMATGLPVLASDHCSLREIITDGTTGMLAQAGNSEQWLALLQGTLQRPDQLAAMGRAAREQFERQYTPAQGYRSLIELYHYTLERAGSSR